MVFEKGEWSSELRQVNKQGQEVIVESRRTLLRDEYGQPRAQLIINTDITEKKSLRLSIFMSNEWKASVCWPAGLPTTSTIC